MRGTLAQDPEMLADLIAARDAQFQAGQAGRADARTTALEKAAKLEGEIQTMLGYMRAGTALASVTQTIADLERQVEELRGTPEAPKPFDRTAFLKAMGAKSFWGVLVQSPAQTRAMLKKLRVTEIIPRPNPEGGWSFLENADLAGLLTSGTPGERAG